MWAWGIWCGRGGAVVCPQVLCGVFPFSGYGLGTLLDALWEQIGYGFGGTLGTVWVRFGYGLGTVRWGRVRPEEVSASHRRFGTRGACFPNRFSSQLSRN